MSQHVTITIDGNDGIRPESVATVMESVFAILASIESRSWPVGEPRMKWRVSEARYVNPLTITSSGEVLIETVEPTPNFALGIIDDLSTVREGRWPSRFTEADMRSARDLGREARRNSSVIIVGRNDVVTKTFSVDRELAAQAQRLLSRPKTVTREYGSIDGTLIALANDPLKAEGTAKIRDRFDQTEVICHAEPDLAARLGLSINRVTRVVVYGRVTSENGVPTSINVEDFTTIPLDDQLASLEDIHALNLSIPDGKTVEDWLDDLRGDG